MNAITTAQAAAIRAGYLVKVDRLFGSSVLYAVGNRAGVWPVVVAATSDSNTLQASTWHIEHDKATHMHVIAGWAFE